MAFGIVYVIANSRMGPNVFKIGQTTRSIDERLAELNGETSLLGRFEVVAVFPVTNVVDAEMQCHRSLSQFRIQTNREFFEIELESLLRILEAALRSFEPRKIVPDLVQRRPNESPGDIGTHTVLEYAGQKSLLLAAKNEQQEKNELKHAEEYASAVTTALDGIRQALQKRFAEIENVYPVKINIPDSFSPMIAAGDEAWLSDDNELSFEAESRYRVSQHGAANSIFDFVLSDKFTPIISVRVFGTDKRQALMPVSHSFDAVAIEPDSGRENDTLTYTPVRLDDGRICDIFMFFVRLYPNSKNSVQADLFGEREFAFQIGITLYRYCYADWGTAEHRKIVYISRAFPTTEQAEAIYCEMVSDVIAQRSPRSRKFINESLRPLTKVERSALYLDPILKHCDPDCLRKIMPDSWLDASGEQIFSLRFPPEWDGAGELRA